MAQTIIRDYVKDLSDDRLDALWGESEAWEANGSLPNNAVARQVHAEVFHDAPLAFALSFLFAEVWRETAVRLSTNA